MEQCCTVEVVQRATRKRSGSPNIESLEESKKRKLHTAACFSGNELICTLLKQQDSDMPWNVEYHVKDGLRFLNPYWTAYKSHAKGRWLQRKLLDVFTAEFLSRSPKYAKVAIKAGRIFVNGFPMTDTEYVVQNSDAIMHICHRHEHPILAKPIEILANTEDLLVVNKPPSMPVHACGQYKLHTVLGLLDVEHHITNLRVLHRLDRTTSGVLLFAKNYETDLKFKMTLKAGEWKKEYVCKVEGVFPEGEIVCEKPLGNLVVSMGIQCIRDDGKNALTRFKRLWTDGKTSVVQCFPETGRTHQIRVHLQYLGFPIVNDQLYNSNDWGPTKGKNAEYGKSLEQLCKDISHAHRASCWLETVEKSYEERLERLANEEVEVDPELAKIDYKTTYDELCLGCHVVKRIPPMSHFMLYLHCLKYETQSWSYSTDLPDWAREPNEANIDSQAIQI